MLSGSAPLLKPGDKAGRYELLLQVAQGGMGAVWVARLKLDNGFEKLFAVKTLLTHLADQTMFREMFLDEARMAAGIEHPNVAQILDLGEQQDLLYLVMEWVEGESLNALARGASSSGRKIPPGILLRVLADASAGLHAVHEHTDRDGRGLDIVHRDVSPHNMLVSARGVTKLIDFGVAKARDRLTGATQSGNVKGKLRYMAPEQACGRAIDRRADVWGIGAVLYALITGRYPYAGETEVDVLRAMISGNAPNLSTASVPAPVDRVIRRALEVDPARRYSTAAELSDALDTAAREIGELENQQSVAAYVESNAGARVAKVRAAIRSAIEDREELYSTIRRRSETDLGSPLQSDPPPDQTHSGTLGSSALDRRSLGPTTLTSRRSLSLYAALGAIVLVAIGATFFVNRKTEPAIPSASATPQVSAAPSAAPTVAESVPAAVEAAPFEPAKIDLDEPPPAPPPARAPAVVVREVKRPVPAPVETTGTPPTKPAVTKSVPSPLPAIAASASTPPKKKLDKAVESAIDTRR